MPLRFRDRYEAGKSLARRLAHYADRPDVLVLALPRGGVPVGYEVSRAIRVPLDLVIVRKLGVPTQPELAMGAVAAGHVLLLDQRTIENLGVSPAEVERTIEVERGELDRRERAYRGDRPPPNIRGYTVILVDDGLATGSTMRAAIRAVRAQDVARVVVAVPVAPSDTAEAMKQAADEFACLLTPEVFHAIGPWYAEFDQVTDQEVRQLLQEAAHMPGGGASPAVHRDPARPGSMEIDRQ